MPTVWTQAKRDFAAANPVEMAAWSGASYLALPSRLSLPFCGYPCEIRHPLGEIIWQAPQTLHENEEVLILQYLAQATGLPLRERWLSFLELPGGVHHDALFRQEALFPLAKRFATDPHQLHRVTECWGGRGVSGYGDAACLISVFPRLSLLVIIWGQDEEFPARAAMLFDASAPGYLTTAALYVLGIAVADRIVETPL